jgi:hypothetical protein
MARTFRNLWRRLVSWDNLLTAYAKCQRGKRSRPEAATFDFAWEEHLLALQADLEQGTYQPGPYHNFYVHIPKRRKISAAPFRDRVVHHAVVRVLEPLYEPRFLHDSYACRRYKGTHRAIHRAQHYMRRHAFYLKTDLVKFFPNVDHGVLLDLVGSRIRDQRLMDLVRIIVASGREVLTDEATQEFFPGDDLFALLRPKGLPIGNLTSQFFANVLLDPIDHFIKEELRVPGYVRYADDLLLFGDDKRQLWRWHDALAQELCTMRMRLHADKTQLRATSANMNFLGFVLSRSGRRLQQSVVMRLNLRLRRLRWLWKHGRIGPEDISRSLAASRANADFGNSCGVLRDVWRRVRFVRSG